LDEDLHYQLKLRAIREKRTLHELIVLALIEFIENSGGDEDEERCD
jgi:hypothetical protein